ncbi:lycopene cyclase domain-containing protein [Cellulomonas marina]|uniref:Lycopene cyclase domain-containing protein n=1 Tax=Cellulomonas marina TaxID=988821 RepID=A0A1I1AVI2_9CELL|nr:lycopene cyclase domain-containing protein [Cellulomonas marina]GIG30700.1 lycopene cyclase [Cellulomonas marina]SFB42054.1 lycopene cyclase domain-containing protein [Cellulomonas marina]
MTYALVNTPFLLLAAVVVVLAERSRRRDGRRHPVRATAVTLVVLVLLTAVFDNVLVGLSIVAYDPTLISGLRVGVAPVEDFAYTVAAVALLPAVWELAGRRGRQPGGS